MKGNSWCCDAVRYSRYGGHTGGAFDTAPEVCILDAMFRSCPEKSARTEGGDGRAGAGADS